MKKILGFMSCSLISMAMLLAIAIMLTGCTDSSNKKVALAVVVGSNSNAPDIPFNGKTVNDAVYNSCYSNGMVTFVTCDGNPKAVYQADIPDYEKSGLSENKKKTIATNYKQMLLKELTKIEPLINEVDTLKAITQSSNALNGAEANSDKVLVVMNSGLSTLGYIDFTKNLLNADTQSIVNALVEAKAVPDLTDVDIVWMYLGQTAGRQDELSEAQKKKLEGIWREVLIAGNAKSVTFTSDIASDYTDKGYPEVSVVNVDIRKIDVISEEVSMPIKTIILDNESVKFIGNKSEFVDYEAAEKVLNEYAQVLIEHPNNQVYVIGTTASGEKNFCKQLSNDRANAVVKVLVNCGVPKSQMLPMGLGFEDPWHIEDLDDNSYQIEKYACQNRKVLIVDVNGNDARKIG